MRQLISVKDISIAKTSCWIYVRYIAEILKTMSNLAAKFKVQLLPLAAVALTVSFKFLGGGGGGGLRHGLSHASLTSMRC